MKTLKKNSNNNHLIDPISEAKKNKRFKKYSQEADLKIRIAEEVFFERERKGLTQQLLAKTVGTTQRIISKIENGDLNPGTYLMFRISKALDFNAYNFIRIYDCFGTERKGNNSVVKREKVKII